MKNSFECVCSFSAIQPILNTAGVNILTQLALNNTYRSNCSSTADSSSNRWTFRGSIDCWVKLSSAL